MALAEMGAADGTGQEGEPDEPDEPPEGEEDEPENGTEERQ